jgi:hypothetical protein
MSAERIAFRIERLAVETQAWNKIVIDSGRIPVAPRRQNLRQ